jgi:hypothetical protein
MHGCDEPYESRDSRTDLWAAGGEIPLADPAHPEESRVVADSLCVGQSLPTPQADNSKVGSAGGVVCLEAANGLQMHNRPLAKYNIFLLLTDVTR